MSWIGYLVLGFTAVAVAYLLWTGLTAGHITGNPAAPLEPALPGFADHRDRAVIYCYSEHCPPCRKMAPDIARLQATHPNVFKLDISRNTAEARAMGIRATPTTLLVEDGKVLRAAKKNNHPILLVFWSSFVVAERVT